MGGCRSVVRRRGPTSEGLKEADLAWEAGTGVEPGPEDRAAMWRLSSGWWEAGGGSGLGAPPGSLWGSGGGANALCVCQTNRRGSLESALCNVESRKSGDSIRTAVERETLTMGPKIRFKD